jgi:hypothetical protein
MTDNKGAAVRTGEKYLQKMQLGDAPAVAKRLTMGIYRMLRDERC